MDLIVHVCQRSSKKGSTGFPRGLRMSVAPRLVTREQTSSSCKGKTDVSEEPPRGAGHQLPRCMEYLNLGWTFSA